MNLEYITTNIGARLSGSKNAEMMIMWSKEVMKNFGADTVWLQTIVVPHWERGEPEKGVIISLKETMNVNVCALGGSIATGQIGLLAEVVEFKNLVELEQVKERAVRGKIVFMNWPFDQTDIDPFVAYEKVWSARSSGANVAARHGAIGYIVRSLASTTDEFSHTGGMSYQDGVQKIPAMAISTLHADLLSEKLKHDGELKFYMESWCETKSDYPSFNVIGEIRGSEFPNEVITVGGHLDSWDLAQGAHDDGAGCVHAMEVIHLLISTAYKPKRTIRIVLFTNEENGLRGGIKYAEFVKQKNENLIAAIESDRGGFVPRGFSISGSEKVKSKIRSWRSLFEPYGITDFSQECGEADIEPLRGQGINLIGFIPDSQRYFSIHHSSQDTFDKVNKRELELGAASITSLVYLIDKYGL